MRSSFLCNAQIRLQTPNIYATTRATLFNNLHLMTWEERVVSQTFDQLEAKLHELSERWVHSDTFLRPAGSSLQKALKLRAIARRFRRDVIASFGVAVHEDIERMHQRVDELERALERTQDRLDERERELQTLKASAPKPAQDQDIETRRDAKPNPSSENRTTNTTQAKSSSTSKGKKSSRAKRDTSSGAS